MGSIAVIRIKGQINIKQKMNDTMCMLRLYRKNYCTIVGDSPETTGMIRKVKDFVAWGKISEEEKANLPKGKFFKLSHIKKPKTGNQKRNIMKMLVPEKNKGSSK